MNNWDLVDQLRPDRRGYLLDRDRSPLYELARSELLWDRRIAMVGSQRFLRRGETSDLYRLAVILLPDRHDLIHKAVGWSLREAGKKVDADELRTSLISTRNHARTALRYAIEHFDPAERQHYLTLPRTPAASASAGTQSQSRGGAGTATSRRKVSGQEVAMLGGEGRKDALLVPGTTGVRDVMNFH